MYTKIRSLLKGLGITFYEATDELNPRWITIQVEDELEPSGFLRYPALLLGPDTAAHIANEELELHYVKPTKDPLLFDYFASSYPVIYVGEDEEEVYHDLEELTAAEFLSKYPCYSQEGGMAKYWHLRTLER